MTYTYVIIRSFEHFVDSTLKIRRGGAGGGERWREKGEKKGEISLYEWRENQVKEMARVDMSITVGDHWNPPLHNAHPLFASCSIYGNRSTAITCTGLSYPLLSKRCDWRDANEILIERSNYSIMYSGRTIENVTPTWTCSVFQKETKKKKSLLIAQEAPVHSAIFANFPSKKERGGKMEGEENFFGNGPPWR